MSEPGPTVSRSVTVVNRKGLHARPSGMISRLVCDYSAKVTVSHGGHSADARSIMDLLFLIAPVGSALTVEAEGPDASRAVEAIVDLVASGFGEPN
ncbi:MAG: HPr family phosphocarrier protein [Pseudomonadota bacterium]